jgi:hypothetical protein
LANEFEDFQLRKFRGEFSDRRGLEGGVFGIGNGVRCRAGLEQAGGAKPGERCLLQKQNRRVVTGILGCFSREAPAGVLEEKMRFGGVFRVQSSRFRVGLGPSFWV